MSSPDKLSLVAKLAEAFNAVGGVEKKGRNEHYHYAYVKAADVAKAVRRELFQRGVILTSDEKEVTETPITTNAGGTMNKLTLKVEYTLRDADSDERITSTAYGVAMDSGDKAIYKAKTGALKYFLRGLGIIPDEKDDPEFDESVDDFTDARVNEVEDRPRARKRGRDKVADYQMRAFDSACHQSGHTAAQVAAFLRERFQVGSVGDLARADFQGAMRWALGTESVEETLKTSLAAAQPKKPTSGIPIIDAMQGKQVAGD